MKIFSYFILLFFPILTFGEGAPWIGYDFKGLPCTGEGQGYGPYDYISQRSKIGIVESHHFTPEVENHIDGKSGYINGDLDYTLRAVPNHHKALLSVIRYQLKLNNKLLRGRPPISKVECYLQRAINFSPNDAFTMSLYGYYLKELGLLEKSAKAYETALKISPSSAKIAYSYSLLLIEMKQYDRALEIAKIAYSNGKAPENLKRKLMKLGVWK